MHFENTKRRISCEYELRTRVTALEQELDGAHVLLRAQISRAEAATAEMQRAGVVAEELRVFRLKEARTKVLDAEKRVVHAEHKASVRIASERAKVEREMRGSLLKVAHLERQLAGREFVEASVHEGMQHRYEYKLAAVQKQLDETAELATALALVAAHAAPALHTVSI